MTRILSRVGIQPEVYVRTLPRSDYPLQRAIGRLAAMREAVEALRQRFLKGTRVAASLLG